MFCQILELHGIDGKVKRYLAEHLLPDGTLTYWLGQKVPSLTDTYKLLDACRLQLSAQDEATIIEVCQDAVFRQAESSAAQPSPNCIGMTFICFRQM